MKASIIKSKYLYSAITIVFVILAWIILSSIIDNTYVFPTFKMLLDGVKLIMIDNFQVILLFLLRIVLVLVISIIISSLIVLLYIWKKNTLGFFTPILSFIHIVPTMGISLYLYLFLDKQIIPFALSVMVTVPIMVEGLITAYDNIDKGIMDVLRLEQISFFKKIFKVYIPIMLPYILMTILQSFSLGIKAMVMGEYLSLTKNSIGFLLYQHQLWADSNVIIVILVLLFTISIICEIVVKILQTKIKNNLIK